MKEIFKGDVSPFSGVILNKKEYEKVQKDKEILDKIDEIVRKQKGELFFEKNT
jgi:hypothetical protein